MYDLFRPTFSSSKVRNTNMNGEDLKGKDSVIFPETAPEFIWNV
jgi:hypothetical protein